MNVEDILSVRLRRARARVCVCVCVRQWAAKLRSTASFWLNAC
jgi:hypothetical protein